MSTETYFIMALCYVPVLIGFIRFIFFNTGDPGNMKITMSLLIFGAIIGIIPVIIALSPQ